MKNKKMVLVALALILCVGIVSAAVLEYYGRIVTTVDVKQAILFDGEPGEHTVSYGIYASGGEHYRFGPHSLESQTTVPIELLFMTSSPIGITTTYTTIITEGPASEYADPYHQLVALDVSGMTLNELVASDLEYTVNVISIPARGFAPCINVWITNDVHTYVVENWGDEWTGISAGLKTQTWGDLVACGVSIRDYLGQPWADVTAPQPFALATYGTWKVIEVEVRAQGGASAGQVIRPVQFKAAGVTIDIPNADTFDTLMLQPEEMLNFYVCYDFAKLIEAKTYTITTTVKPAP